MKDIEVSNCKIDPLTSINFNYNLKINISSMKNMKIFYANINKQHTRLLTIGWTAKQCCYNLAPSNA